MARVTVQYLKHVNLHLLQCMRTKTDRMLNCIYKTHNISHSHIAHVYVWLFAIILVRNFFFTHFLSLAVCRWKHNYKRAMYPSVSALKVAKPIKQHCSSLHSPHSHRETCTDTPHGWLHHCASSKSIQKSFLLCNFIRIHFRVHQTYTKYLHFTTLYRMV